MAAFIVHLVDTLQKLPRFPANPFVGFPFPDVWAPVGGFWEVGFRVSGEAEERESIEYDVVVVGAGPAGLSAAMRLKHLCQEKGQDLNLWVVEKGAEVGAHSLSGNVFETRALDELIPDWKHQQAVFISFPPESGIRGRPWLFGHVGPSRSCIPLFSRSGVLNFTLCGVNFWIAFC